MHSGLASAACPIALGLSSSTTLRSLLSHCALALSRQAPSPQAEQMEQQSESFCHHLSLTGSRQRRRQEESGATGSGRLETKYNCLLFSLLLLLFTITLLPSILLVAVCHAEEHLAVPTTPAAGGSGWLGAQHMHGMALLCTCPTAPVGGSLSCRQLTALMPFKVQAYALQILFFFMAHKEGKAP